MGGFIRFIKKQYFWLIIPVLLGVMVATWYMAAADQIKQFDTRVSAIKNDFSSMGNIVSSNPEHPNREYHEGMKKMIKSRAVDVEEAWATQYKKQVRVQKWSNQMKPDFIALVDQMRPIEKFAGDEEKSPEVARLMNDVLPWMKQSYRDFIATKEMVRLADIISAQWTVDMSPGGGGGGGGAYGGGGGYGGEGAGGSSDGGYGGGYGGGGGDGGYGGGYGGGGGGYGGGGGGYGGGGEDYDDDELVPYVVLWTPACQEQIKMNSFGWLGRGSGEPTLIEMLYTQEDLWVLDSLMQIIAATNGDARIKEQAAVKQIDTIQLGIAASRQMKGNISAVQSADADEDDGMVMGMGGGGDPYGGGGGYGGDPYGGMGGDDLDDEEGGFSFDPLEERYVDKDYVKLASADVTSRASSDTLSDVMVAKRIPVRIKVSMDTRKLAHFLSACANAPLTFEVHQIRINATDGAAGGMAMMGGGDGYGGGGAGGGYGGGGYGGGGYGGGGYGGGADDMEGVPAETYDKTVEFFGLVNIFNPVDRKKLYSAIQSEDGEAEEAPADEPEPAEEPADEEEAADENEVAAAN